MRDDSFEGWQELLLASKRGCPKLFYKFSIAKDGCNVRLTDLMTLWECPLHKEEIKILARGKNSSIDPSESVAQYQVFLTKLHESLQQGRNKLTRDIVDATQALILRTRLDLPKPLKPLDWTFRLLPQGASALAEQILRPSLHEVQTSTKQIESLLKIIKEKDHVLSKVLDKIGQSAIDISLLFPGTTGMMSRKGHVRIQDAMKHVPGMAPFDEDSWRQRIDSEGESGASQSTGLAILVTGNAQCFKHTKSEHEGWMKTIPVFRRSEGDASRSGSPSVTHSTPVEGVENASTPSQDEFERLATPPSLKSKNPDTKRKVSSLSDLDDMSTDEREEPPQKRAKSFRIGTLGHKGQKKKQESPADIKSSSPHPTQDISLDSSTETASSTSDHMPSRDKNITPEKTQRNLAKSTMKPRTISPLLKSTKEASSPSKHRLGRLAAQKTSDTGLPDRGVGSDSESETKPHQTRATKPGSKKLSSLAKPSHQKQISDDDDDDDDDNDDDDLNNRSESDEVAAPLASVSEPDSSSERVAPTTRRQVQELGTGQGEIEDNRQKPISAERAESPESAANRRREELKKILNTNNVTDAAGTTLSQSPQKKKKRRF